MGLGDILRRTGIGLFLAGCSQEVNNYYPSNITVETETVFTNPQGLADFNEADDIPVESNQGQPLPSVEVTSYRVWRDGNYIGSMYLAKTAQGEGGVLVSAASTRRAGRRREGGLGEALIIRPSEGYTLFDEEQEVVYDLFHWTLDDQYSCNGTFSSKELQGQREIAIDLVARFDPTGLVSLFYDGISWLMDHGVLSNDLPPGEQWYSITPDNPTGQPIDIQKSLAEQEFGTTTYEQLQEACGPGNPDDMQNPPDDLEELLELCDEYYQKYDFDCSGSADRSQEKADADIAKVCRPKNYDALCKDRANLECAREKSCDDFWTCLGF